MEYFYLMMGLFLVLFVMKAISQGNELVQVLFFILWVYSVWKFYPYVFSGSDKWRSSPVAIFINRIIALVFAMYAFVYVMGL